MKLSMKNLINGLVLSSLTALCVGVSSLDAQAQQTPAKTAESASESEEAAASEAAARRAALRRRYSTTADTKITVGGKEAKITHSTITLTTGPDYPGIAALKKGEVLSITLSAAPKLRTDLNLKFGNALIKTENVAKDYPGVYSLWIKRTSDGWSLLFNEKADLWGTMHDATADVAEVPLAYEFDKKSESEIQALRAEEDAKGESLKVSLDAKGDSGGTLQVKWGAHTWTTNFTVAS